MCAYQPSGTLHPAPIGKSARAGMQGHGRQQFFNADRPSVALVAVRGTYQVVLTVLMQPDNTWHDLTQPNQPDS